MGTLSACISDEEYENIRQIFVDNYPSLDKGLPSLNAKVSRLVRAVIRARTVSETSFAGIESSRKWQLAGYSRTEGRRASQRPRPTTS